MNTTYSHRKSIRITLDLEVYDDFNYNEIDFSSLLELEGNETVEVSITDHSDVEVY
jgi:hypothetical protein